MKYDRMFHVKHSIFAFIYNFYNEINNILNVSRETLRKNI